MSIEYTSAETTEYKWFADQCLRLKSYGSKAIQDGSSLVICKHTPLKATLIMFGGGIAVHPRSSLYPNGYNTQTEKGLSTTAMFPLYDDDHGSMLIDLEGSIATVDKNPDAENYGIFSWTNDTNTVSWRGFPALTLGFPRTLKIEGVTQLDVQTNSATYYTPLGSQVYVAGESIPTPGKVRGAGYTSDGRLVVITTVNYTQYDFIGSTDATLNPRGTKGGYFDELYIEASAGTDYIVNGVVTKATEKTTNQQGIDIGNWLRIGYHDSPINNMPIWFSQDAKTAVEDFGTWSWTFDGNKTFTSSFTVRSAPVPQVKTVTPSPHWSMVATGLSWELCHTLSKFCTIESTRNDSSAGFGSSDSADKEVTVKMAKRPDPVGYYITETTSYVLNATQTVHLFQAIGFKSGPFTWQGASTGTPPGQTGDWKDTGMAWSISTSSCVDHAPAAPVMGTVTATDLCGFQASLSVVISSETQGSWGATINSSCDIIPTSGSYDNGQQYFTDYVPASHDITYYTRIICKANGGATYSTANCIGTGAGGVYIPDSGSGCMFVIAGKSERYFSCP